MRRLATFIMMFCLASVPAAADPTTTAAATVSARATILHPVTLKITPNEARLLQDEPRSPIIAARPTERPCGNDASERCRTIVYDLP